MTNVVLTGRIVYDVKLVSNDGKISYVNNVIACNPLVAKNKTIFVPFKVFGSLAEKLFYPYLKKGDKIMICGHLDQENYTASNGAKKNNLFILVEKCEVFGSTNLIEETPSDFMGGKTIEEDKVVRQFDANDSPFDIKNDDFPF